MIVKISLTTKCGAQCLTCPVWTKPAETMPVDKFRELWPKVQNWPGVEKVFLNSTGDINALDNRREYYNIIEGYQKEGVEISVTTNAANLDYIPRVQTFVISFNGSNQENYHKTTGLDFDQVVANVRAAYPQLREKVGYREIDCLIWRGTEGCEEEFIDLWKDFPGSLRLGFKVENQNGDYMGLDRFRDDKRIPCDYLEGITIAPSGQVIRCPHDFDFSTDWGNVFSDTFEAIAGGLDRVALYEDHQGGVYTGLCKKCNYNVDIGGKFYYLKGAQ